MKQDSGVADEKIGEEGTNNNEATDDDSVDDMSPNGKELKSSDQGQKYHRNTPSTSLHNLTQQSMNEDSNNNNPNKMYSYHDSNVTTPTSQPITAPNLLTNPPQYHAHQPVDYQAPDMTTTRENTNSEVSQYQPMQPVPSLYYPPISHIQPSQNDYPINDYPIGQQSQFQTSQSPLNVNMSSYNSTYVKLE